MDKWRAEQDSAKKMLLTPICLGMAALFAFLGVMFFVLHISPGIQQVKNTQRLAVRLYQHLTLERLAIMGSSLDVLSADERLAELLRNKEADTLYREYGKIFRLLRKSHGIQQLTLIAPDFRVVTRMHRLHDGGDIISRSYFSVQKPPVSEVAGLQVSGDGKLTLRVLRPLYIGNTLAGYIEMGVDLAPVLKRIAELRNVHLAIAMDKASRSGQEVFFFSLDDNIAWVAVGKDTIVYTTLVSMESPLAEDILNAAEPLYPGDRLEHGGFYYEGRYYYATGVLLDDWPSADSQLFVFEDVSGSIFGHLLHAVLFLVVGSGILLLTRRQVMHVLKHLDGRMEDMVRAIRQGEQAFEHIFAESETGFVIFSSKTKDVLRANSAALGIFGVPVKTDIRLEDMLPLHPNDPLQRLWSETGTRMPLTAVQRGQERRLCALTRFSIAQDGGDTECIAMRDVTRVVMLQRENQEHITYLQEAINQLPGIICIKDSQLRLTMYNDMFESLFGTGDNMLHRIRYSDMITDVMSRLMAADRQALESGEAVVIDVPLTLRDGKQRTMQVAKKRIIGQDGAKHILTVGSDITERIRMEQQLVALRQKAEESSRAKTLFLARMSHEIRTPMNIILGMCHLALNAGLEGRNKDYVEKIQNAARNLLGLINDILDFSKVEAGEMRLAAMPFSLTDLLRDLESSGQALVDERPIKFILEAPEETLVIVGDPQRLRQVLLNLINNAIKFTHGGFVRLVCKVEEEKGDWVDLYFAVEDTGIGIPQESLDAIFFSYQQVPGQSIGYEGTGLGLPICRQFVGLMGGDIRVESELGRGTKFYFTLSFARLEEKKAMLQEDKAPRFHKDSLAGKVLIVEDNPLNQEILLEMLEGYGLAARAAANGLEAVQLLGAEPYDLVFMDIKMPVMDGLKATEIIRRQETPWAATVPIVALTASAMEEDRQQCLDAGMSGFLSKPIDMDDLSAALLRWLGREEETNPNGPS